MTLKRLDWLIMHNDYNAFLDATQDDCPVPLIRAKEMLDKMQIGEVLKVAASKEGTVSNIRMFVKNNPYELIREAKLEKNYQFYIKKL